MGDEVAGEREKGMRQEKGRGRGGWLIRRKVGRRVSWVVRGKKMESGKEGVGEGVSSSSSNSRVHQGHPSPPPPGSLQLITVSLAPPSYCSSFYRFCYSS